MLRDICVSVFVEQEDEEANTGSHLKLIVDAFIQQLPNCVNRDLIDKVRTGSDSQPGKKKKGKNWFSDEIACLNKL